MALAVGILVDDGTVTIENINYHLEKGKPIETAIMDGAQQIVIPAFVTLLCLCIVFVPMFQLGGVAGYLFRPLAEAVVFALLGSFVLSRTLVPTMAHYLLHGHALRARNFDAAADMPIRSRSFSGRSTTVSPACGRATAHCWCSRSVGRKHSSPASLLACCCPSALWPFLGENFFPTVDSGKS